MDFFPYRFEAEITAHNVGSDKYDYTVIWVPDEIVKCLPFDQSPRLRIIAEIDTAPLKAALMPVRGSYYILLSKKLLKTLKKLRGDTVLAAFRLDDPNAVDVPAYLETALSYDPDMKVLWDQQTPGKQRALAHMVATAKTDATREKRVSHVFWVLMGDIDLKGRPVN
ncbi:MAG: YdeI/OmpD-associated family protein [Pseudomonadota bacterium]